MNKRLAFIGILWLISFGISIVFGRTGFPELSSIFELRFIRALLGTIAGLILAANGAALQSFFANPLVEPHTIGISSGAALGYVLSVVIGIPFVLRYLFAIAGGIFSLTLIYRLSLRDGHLEKTAILLIGISISFLTSAVTMLLFSLKGEVLIRSVRFIWGYIGVVLTKNEAAGFIFGSIVALLAIGRIWLLSRELDAISLGDSEALALGVDVERLKKRLFWMSAVAIGILVSMVGIIGFVGLIVPHIARNLMRTASNKVIIPASAVLGATFVLLADTIARFIAPVELPIGVVTSLLGIPFFILIFRKSIK